MNSKITLFISDIHLRSTKPNDSFGFDQFLNKFSDSAKDIYILGDLFDFWIGDDQTLSSKYVAQVIKMLRKLTLRGINIFFMHGNRDFLIGEEFSCATGIKIIPDETVIDLLGERYLLMHGDTLCTGDKKYMAFRHLVRQKKWQEEFLNKSIDERISYVRSARASSDHHKNTLRSDIMNVDVAEVISVMNRNRCRKLIHGHTHKPAHHRHIKNSVKYDRYVLPDWESRGGYLLCDNTECRLVFN